jgi:YegS/Rv2252/BmrU family lipid kinase
MLIFGRRKMLDFIINPIAGGKHGRATRKIVAKIEEFLQARGVEYALHLTTRQGHARTLTESLIKKGCTDIIVVGGDGTLHEVINGFSNFENVNLGLIPCGTGNDFASAIKIPKDPIKALKLIVDGTPKYTDFMQMPSVRGINIIGTGIDVDVLKAYNKLKRKNKLGYTWCLIKTLFKFEYSDFTAKVDGESHDYRSFIACIANGHVYGGGIPICPPADPTDNKLNFLAVKEIPRLKIVGAFLKLKAGKIMSFKQTEHFACQQVEINTKKPCAINVDGELYENIPFEVKIISNTLKMYR